MMSSSNSENFSILNNVVKNTKKRKHVITVTILGVSIFIILLAYVASGVGEQHKSNSSLKLVYAIFRHGDRNPTETYPNDPYNNLKFWPEGWGALTKKGKLQMYNVGLLLKTRYGWLLNNTYSPERILVRSSDHDRCLMSAGTLLAGLLPPADSEIWLPALMWQPIPVHATPRSLDKLIVVKKPCPVYEEELRNAYKDKEITEIDKDNAEFYQYISQNAGKNISSVLDVEFLYNTLEIEENVGLKLPEWVKSDHLKKMRRLAEISVAIFTQNSLMKRLVGGPLLYDILKTMNSKEADALKPDRSVFLISGHDMTLVNIMRSLSFSDPFKPDIGASLVFELHAETTESVHNKHFVKVLYFNSSSTEIPHVVKLPGCEENCDLQKFRLLIKDVVIGPDDWEQQCLH